ncbi:hypothetical protein F4780DRAFT_281095 [Xylariomycetidae sp. FL0641]|nr:hypothetical protein F4780DRAFT_281095 [Xylariomycetidae sp. FL0641]
MQVRGAATHLSALGTNGKSCRIMGFLTLSDLQETHALAMISSWVVRSKSPHGVAVAFEKGFVKGGIVSEPDPLLVAPAQDGEVESLAVAIVRGRARTITKWYETHGRSGAASREGGLGGFEARVGKVKGCLVVRVKPWIFQATNSAMLAGDARGSVGVWLGSQRRSMVAESARRSWQDCEVAVISGVRCRKFPLPSFPLSKVVEAKEIDSVVARCPMTQDKGEAKKKHAIEWLASQANEV